MAKKYLQEWYDSNDISYSAKINRSCNRSKNQIKDEKFQERIVVYPKDWCRIS